MRAVVGLLVLSFLGLALGATFQVSITTFAPFGNLAISPGDTVTWTNNHGNNPHTITYVPASDTERVLFNSGILSNGNSFSFTFTVSGTYNYYDAVHPSQTGTIVVCTSIQVPCNNTCTNVQSDNVNCGRCGLACLTGQTCSGGVCTGTPCLSPRTLCGNNCVTLSTDRNNCGTCGNQCVSSQTCNNGVCTCPPGRVLCNNNCIDVSADVNNCGACGARCQTGQFCQSNVCQCPTRTTLCGTSCVDTTTSATNCGACGVTCSSNQTCVSGQCNCNSGLTRCGGVCKNLNTDILNCGACNFFCNVGFVCSGGACVWDTTSRPDVFLLLPGVRSNVTASGSWSSTATVVLNAWDERFWGGFFPNIFVPGNNQVLQFTVAVAGIPQGAVFELYISQEGSNKQAAIQKAIYPANPALLTSGQNYVSIRTTQSVPFFIVLRGTGNLRKRSLQATSLTFTVTESVVSAALGTPNVLFTLNFANVMPLLA